MLEYKPFPFHVPYSQLPSWSKKLATAQPYNKISILLETMKHPQPPTEMLDDNENWLPRPQSDVCFLSTNLGLLGIQHVGCLSLPTNPTATWYLKLRGQQIWRQQKECPLVLTMTHRCHWLLIFLRVSIHNWQSSAHMDSMVDHWLDTTPLLQDERYSQL